MIDDTNCTTNHRWHLAHTIRQAIQGMDERDREQALARIHTELFKGETPDPEILSYVTVLLNGSTPRKGISRR